MVTCPCGHYGQQGHKEEGRGRRRSRRRRHGREIPGLLVPGLTPHRYNFSTFSPTLAQIAPSPPPISEHRTQPRGAAAPGPRPCRRLGFCTLCSDLLFPPRFWISGKVELKKNNNKKKSKENNPERLCLRSWRREEFQAGFLSLRDAQGGAQGRAVRGAGAGDADLTLPPCNRSFLSGLLVGVFRTKHTTGESQENPPGSPGSVCFAGLPPPVPPPRWTGKWPSTGTSARDLESALAKHLSGRKRT